MAEISPNGARRIYRILCNLAASDGTIDVTEREVLDDVAEYFDFDRAQSTALEEEGIAGTRLGVGANPTERAYLIGCMIDVAAADGVLAPEELERLNLFAEAVGLSSEELSQRLVARFGDASPSSAPSSVPPPASPQSPASPRPSVEGAERLEVAGFEVWRVRDESETKSYGPGEKETTAYRDYLLDGGGGWALFRARRTYLASDRFDKETIRVEASLDTGASFVLGRSMDYEKYSHAQDYDEREPLDPLLDAARRWGLGRAEPGPLAELVSGLMHLP